MRYARLCKETLNDDMTKLEIHSKALSMGLLRIDGKLFV